MNKKIGIHANFEQRYYNAKKNIYFSNEKEKKNTGKFSNIRVNCTTLQRKKKS